MTRRVRRILHSPRIAFKQFYGDVVFNVVHYVNICHTLYSLMRIVAIFSDDSMLVATLMGAGKMRF